MDLALWIVSGLLAVVFAVGGTGKIIVAKETLATYRFAGWTNDWSSGAIKTIGALEVLAAVGLILPAVLGIVPVLVPLAATGLVVVMIGAIVVHARRRGESVNIMVNLAYLALAAFVALGRFGPESFSA